MKKDSPREYGCEFLVFDETLLNSIKLDPRSSKTVIMNMGQTRWYEKIKKDASHCIGLDPSMGTGGDYALYRLLNFSVINK